MNNPNQKPANSQMPQGAQGQQAPGQQTQNPPDHRWEEMQREMKAMRDQNSQLRGQIDYITQQNNGNQQAAPTTESPFDPTVDKALDAKFQAMIDARLNPIMEKTTQQIGFIHDKQDQLNYNQQYSGEKFAKYNDQVERLRQEYQMKGQYIPREEALRMVHWEETGKKAQINPAAPVEQAKQPVWDHYLQSFVDPITRTPTAPPEQNFGPAEERPPEGAPPWQGEQPPQAPVQQQPNQPMPTGFHQPGEQHQGGQNPYAQAPQGGNQNPYPNQQLPGQGLNNQVPIENKQAGYMNLDIDSSDEQLDAFANKFGDIPL